MSNKKLHPVQSKITNNFTCNSFYTIKKACIARFCTTKPRPEAMFSQIRFYNAEALERKLRVKLKTLQSLFCII